MQSAGIHIWIRRVGFKVTFCVMGKAQILCFRIIYRAGQRASTWPDGNWTQTGNWTQSQSACMYCNIDNHELFQSGYWLVFGWLRKGLNTHVNSLGLWGWGLETTHHLNQFSLHFRIVKHKKEVDTQSRNQGIFLQFWQILAHAPQSSGHSCRPQF